MQAVVQPVINYLKIIFVNIQVSKFSALINNGFYNAVLRIYFV